MPSFWVRHQTQIRIVILAVAAWATPIADAIAVLLGVDGPPITGSPNGLVGAYIFLTVETVWVCALALTWVPPVKMGLFLPRHTIPARKWWLVFALAIAMFIAAYGLRLLSLLIAGIPIDPGPSDWWDLPWALRSGIYQQIPIAAAVFLMYRAGWSPVTIIVLIGVVRMLFHAHRGVYSILPSLLLGAGIAALFIHYRRVGPLIAAHTAYDVGMWAIWKE